MPSVEFLVAGKINTNWKYRNQYPKTCLPVKKCNCMFPVINVDRRSGAPWPGPLGPGWHGSHGGRGRGGAGRAGAGPEAAFSGQPLKHLWFYFPLTLHF